MNDRTSSLLEPAGHLTLGNLLDALEPMAHVQDFSICFYGVCDLRGLTVRHDPARPQTLTRDLETALLAVGPAADATHVDAVFATGAEHCQQVTAPVLSAASAAIGLM